MTEQFQKKLSEEFAKGFDELYSEMLVCNAEFEDMLRTLKATDLTGARIDDCVKRCEAARRRLLMAATAARNFAHYFIELCEEPPTAIYKHVKAVDRVLALCAIPVMEPLTAAVGR
jgi:hypothetical protein